MNFGELLMASSMEGGIDPPPENQMAKEMRILYKKPLKYDKNIPAIQAYRNATAKTGVNGALLLSSGFGEGGNKAIAHQDEVSDAYLNAKIGNDYPVDAFYNYGIDKFSEYLPRIKQDLPQGFENEYKMYPATNEQGEKINTAAFRTNEGALIAKAAILKDTMREVDGYAKSKGIELDDTARNYFTFARYNAKPENFKIMMDEYSKATDKKRFIEKGETSRKGVHKNIFPRIENLSIAQSLLDEK